MYYEEKLIDGILHFRGTPDGEWRPMTLAMYERRRLGDRLRIEQLEAALRWYADEANYRGDSVMSVPMVTKDNGHIARKALE